jgi:glycosyltransferase involved in cell wall biosynthesis
MISNKIKVSALGSLYIKESPIFLEQALDSLLKQTYELDEIVLMIDGPILQEHEEVISKNKYSKLLNIYRLENNVGLGEALKIGIGKIQNEYILRFDTDDINHQDRLQCSLEYLVSEDLDVCSSNVIEFNNSIGDLNIIKKVPYQHNKIVRFAKWRSPMNHMAVLYRKSTLLKHGAYENVLNFEDYYLWCKLLQNGAKFGNLQQPLVYARIGNDMIGRRKGVSYFKREYYFAKRVYSMGFFSAIEFLRFLIIRLPMRILPKKVLVILYKKILRSKLHEQN